MSTMARRSELCFEHSLIMESDAMVDVVYVLWTEVALATPPAPRRKCLIKADAMNLCF